MNTKKIFFLRTAPYDYLVEGMDLYDSFNVVAKGDIGMKLKSNAKELFKNNVPSLVFKAKSVYTSPRNSLPKTAKFISNTPKSLKQLVEIGYVMEDFIQKSEFYDEEKKPMVNLARERFVQAFIDDQLQERREKVFERIEYILKQLSNDRSKVILVITHGFILKLFESYIRNTGIRSNPEMFKKYFNGKTEGFKFCEGFSVNLNEENKFTFDSYIKNKI